MLQGFPATSAHAAQCHTVASDASGAFVHIWGQELQHGSLLLGAWVRRSDKVASSMDWSKVMQQHGLEQGDAVG